MLRVAPRHKRLASGGTGLLVGLLLMLVVPSGASAFESSTADRYSIVHGCYALQSVDTGKFVAKSAGAYDASAGRLGAAEPFRMQATALGRFLFYDTDKEFMAVDGQGVSADPEPSNAADWTVKKPGPAFEAVNTFEKRELGTRGDELTATGSVSGNSGRFNLIEAEGCPKYPEITTNVKGAPTRTFPRYKEATGQAETHMHHMAFKFLGGAHCGRPWHRFGVQYALVDCEDHEVGDGCGAVLDNVLYGDPARCHDTTGWPEFTDWPHHQSLTHEQSYYKWLERSWRSGLRVFVNLMVQNRVLCELYPLKGDNDECDDTKTVYIELREAYKLQDYIDAQEGGPGKGWYRIVRDPFEARRVINQGKLAVVLGMEVSEPFGCRMYQGIPTCDEEQITHQLDKLQSQGVVQLEITNKFDNALTGVAGDAGEIGLLTNFGNFYATGRFWDLDTCTGPEGEHDHTPVAAQVPHNDDLILANVIREYGLGGVAPVYPPPPHCNQRGLTALGEHAVKEIVERKMIFDPDHQSVIGRDEALKLLERMRYPGVTSSHSWSTPAALPRIFRLGGMIGPSTGTTEGFVEKWKEARTSYRGRQYFGLGYGADQNGFATQGGPREGNAENPVEYPFKSIDGKQTIYKQTSGNRVYDINVDGVAHYGLYPDWMEDLRQIQGNKIVRDLNRGAEAYLQMWERAEGVPAARCRTWRGAFSRKGLSGNLKVGRDARSTLFSAGQPIDRKRAWKWCTRFKKKGAPRKLDRKRTVAAVFNTRGKAQLVASSLAKNTAGGVGRGDRARALKGKARKVRGGVYVERSPRGNAWVWGVRKGKVRWAGVATPEVASSNRQLRNYARRTGL